MNRQKGKLFALAMGVAGVITLAIGAPSWRELVEGWYIWRLDSGDQITRDFAIEKLGERGSATSIPHLVKLMGSRGGSSGSSLALGALLRIGNVSNKDLERLLVPVIPTLIAELQTHSLLELGKTGLFTRG